MPYDIVIGRDKEDKKLFGDKGLIFIGKGYVQMGNYTSLSNRLWLDVVRSHVILIAGKRGCLVGDTLVFTDNGYKPIKEFDQMKDKVLSFDKEKKEFEWENAELLTYIINNESLLEIEFENNKKITLTKEHPLLMVQGERLLSLLWIKANQLKKDDMILSVGKSIEDLIPCKIKSIKEIQGIKKVYDLTVPKNHSFIANGIISHNSGKSYSIGVISEEMSKLPQEVRENIAPLIFDTMGIFWTMKFKNDKDIILLDEWGLKGENLPIKVWIPYGYFEEFEKRKMPIDSKFALAVNELDVEDWLSIFKLDMINPVSILIQKIIAHLQEMGMYDLDDIIHEVENNSEAEEITKKSAVSLFEAAKSWKVFAKKFEPSTKINELIRAGTTSILDMSMYSSTANFNVRALIIGLISKKLFNERMLARKKEEVDEIYYGMNNENKKEMPLIWLFLDEAHEFLPAQGETPATNSLIQLLREGRQPGISLVLATQQPGVIHRDVMTQSDIVIAHRLTNKHDIEALNEIMQTYLLENIQKSMRELPDVKGAGIILDDNSERLYPVRIRPRLTWHGGEAPKAISKKEKELFA